MIMRIKNKLYEREKCCFQHHESDYLSNPVKGWAPKSENIAVTVCSTARGQMFENIFKQFLDIEKTRNVAAIVRFCGQNGFILSGISFRDYFHAKGYLKNKDMMMAAVGQYCPLLAHIDEALRNDREVVTAAIQQDPHALIYAGANLRGDRELTLMAVAGGLEMHNVVPELLHDKQIVLSAIEVDCKAYGSVPTEMRDDLEVAIAALKKDGMLLEHCSGVIRNDCDAVLAAVKKHALSLKYAGSEPRAKKEIVLACLSGCSWVHCGYLMKHASDELRSDLTVTMAALDRDPGAIKFTEGPGKHDGPTLGIMGWALEKYAFDIMLDALPCGPESDKVRKVAWAYFELPHKFRAFTMSQHSRLGEESIAKCLDDNLVCMIRDALLGDKYPDFVSQMRDALPPGREVPRF